jgi:uncharacterized protein YdhG (YjbR/CyaY superfamily)
MRSKASSIEEYIADLPADRAAPVREICRLVAEGSPGNQPTMEHGMPFFKLNGDPYIAVASQKQNISVYVVEMDQTLAEHPELDRKLPRNRGKNCLRYNPARIDDEQLLAISELIRLTYERCRKPATAR